MLFDKTERTYLGPASNSESTFQYLNRSARPEAEVVRRTLERWFRHYPGGEQPEFVARFRSEAQFACVSATFELYLHELLRKLGYEVSVHPRLGEGKRRKPDFLATAPDGSEVLVEAVIASDAWVEDPGANARMNAVYDQLNDLDSPNFFLHIKIHGTPRTQPSVKKLKRQLEVWLTGLDPDQVAPLLESRGLSELPKFSFQHEGWKLEFSPIPKSPEARDKPGVRPIGSRFLPPKWGSCREAIRDAVQRKGRHYGNRLARPFVVAVNACVVHVDQIDAMEALFGQELWQVDILDPKREPTMHRAQDGAWYGPQGPRYTRISGVLLVENLGPWSLASAGARLYLNPWAKLDLCDPLTKLPSAIPSDLKMQFMKGRRPRVILGLGPHWPSATSA